MIESFTISRGQKTTNYMQFYCLYILYADEVWMELFL